MPIILDKIDTALIKSLLENGRKSFRQISRETGITTPTIKAHYERLVNIGFIKGVIPIFAFDKIDTDEEITDEEIIQFNAFQEDLKKGNNDLLNKNRNTILEELFNNSKKEILDDIKINLVCDLCDGLINNKPKILKFANIERFFCCISCKSIYSEKYKGKIESIKRKYEGKAEIDF